MALGTRREQPGQAPVKLGETTKRFQPPARKRHQFLDGGKITSLNTEALGLRGKEIRVHAFVDHVDILCNLLRVLLFLPARGRDRQIAFRKGIELAEVTDAALGKLHGGPGRPLRKKGVIGPLCIIPFRIHGMERLRENILREKTGIPIGDGRRRYPVQSRSVAASTAHWQNVNRSASSASIPALPCPSP